LLLAVVAAGGIAWLISASGSSQSASEPLPEIPVDVEADPSAGLALGDADAPVTIMDFSDYSCPHCARFASFTGRLMRQNYVENGGPVRWIHYDYVLGTFPNSVAASIAARCAGDQGRYWPMHDLLLARQTRWAMDGDPNGRFREIADDLGLDGGEFGSCLREQRHLDRVMCLREQRHLDRVMAVRKYGDELGVNSTPTLFLNGRRLDLATEGDYTVLERLVQQAVSESESAVSEGE
jgi:protein-disulfide isomerase